MTLSDVFSSIAARFTLAPETNVAVERKDISLGAHTESFLRRIYDFDNECVIHLGDAHTHCQINVSVTPFTLLPESALTIIDGVKEKLAPAAEFTDTEHYSREEGTAVLVDLKEISCEPETVAFIQRVYDFENQCLIYTGDGHTSNIGVSVAPVSFRLLSPAARQHIETLRQKYLPEWPAVDISVTESSRPQSRFAS